MIADPGLLSSSPWSTDVFKDLQSDILRSYLNGNDGLDLGFPMVDVETEKTLRSSGNRDINPGFTSSCTNSSASSECSEELSFDFVWQNDNHFCNNNGNTSFRIPDHDYLNTSLNLLDENITVCPDDFDWAVEDNFLVTDLLLNDDGPSSCSKATTASVPCLPKQKCSGRCDPLRSNKQWSDMTQEEQLEAVEGLTNIISAELGLREQLDVIRIIEPTAVISPSDTEFVIDLNALNDRKLQSVRDYVRRVQQTLDLTTAESKECGKRTSTTSKVTTTSTKVNSSSNSHIKANCTTSTTKPSNAAANSSRGKNGKRGAKERRPPPKVCKPRQKELRQLRKELKSGLFVREEILSISTTLVIEDDIDVDILD